jgi:hypothetical protein
MAFRENLNLVPITTQTRGAFYVERRRKLERPASLRNRHCAGSTFDATT